MFVLLHFLLCPKLVEGRNKKSSNNAVAGEAMVPMGSLRENHSASLRSRRALMITDTELNVIAALAIIGLSRMPKNG
jgi:hypothetical protein